MLYLVNTFNMVSVNYLYILLYFTVYGIYKTVRVGDMMGIATFLTCY